jgi:hypothetical protein
MRIPGPSRRPTVAPGAGVPLASSWPRTFRPVWGALAGWPARIPVGHGPTGSSDRQSEPKMGVRGTSEVAGPGGGATLEWGVSVAPPPLFPPPEPAAISSAEHQTLSALQPAVTANDPPSVIRVRVVLLPHAPDRAH